MKVVAVNGSPRKKWNTATLLEKALEGAASRGAETRLVHLYELKYQGCISCFACKKRGGKSYGNCAVDDDLTRVLARVREADAIVLGSPIYFGEVTGEMRSFMERLFFPWFTYTDPPQSLFPRKIRSGWIYTMNSTEEWAGKLGYGGLIERNEQVARLVFGHAASLASYDTLQFKDYAKVVADRFDPAQKEQRRREVFPEDCRKAHELGASLVEGGR